jgi:2-methylcitrate dehydratase PrpD
MTLANDLAERVAATRFGDLSPAARHYARIGILDTIGVMLAGSKDEAANIARRVCAQAPGPALLLGTSRRVAPMDAAFANGVAANVLDYDDCTDHLGGHPSSPVLPGLFALAESRGASGEALMTAYVAGFEIETQLGRGLNLHHYEKGWHPTATLGVFGAGAACAHLLGLSVERVSTTLSLCASLAAGVKSNLGSMAKPMHVGHASRSGLMAALLAAEGYTANAEAFEHKQGFLEVFNGAGHYDTAAILAKWGRPFDIELPGIAVKQYPCCLSTQSAMDLMLDLVRDNDVAADKVARIDVRTPAHRLAHTDRPDPRSDLEAKLSVQYVLAVAVAARRLGLEHFTNDASKDAGVRALMRRVHAEPLAGEPGARAGDAVAEIRLTMTDGSTIAGRIERPVGHAPGEPLEQALLERKFHACAGTVLPRAAADEVLALVTRFETLADFRELTVALECSAGDAAGQEPQSRAAVAHAG